MKKIIAGLVVVIAAAGVVKVTSANKEPVQEEIIKVEENDASDHLYENTFEDDVNAEEYSDEKEETDIEEETDTVAEEYKEGEQKEEGNSSSTESASKTITGEFQGFADGSVIEVKIGNTYDVFRVSDEMKSKLESKKIGQTITFTYVASAGQQVITSIN